MTEQELMPRDDRALLQAFTDKLNKEPDPKELELTPDGKAKTLPVSFIEMTLDELYFGQWELSEPTYQQIFNEVVGTAILTVWNPINDRPIRRAGFASVVITQDKDATIAEFNQTKKKNALDLTFPKLKAEILKNAAQSLGKIFGRDINRKKVDTFKAALKPIPDDALFAAIKRIEDGMPNILQLCESNFLLTDIAREMLVNAKPKMLNGK